MAGENFPGASVSAPDAWSEPHDEDAFAEVRRAHLSRRKQARRTAITHCVQLTQHDVKAQVEVARDVLQHEECGFNFESDAAHVGP